MMNKKYWTVLALMCFAPIAWATAGTAAESQEIPEKQEIPENQEILENSENSALETRDSNLEKSVPAESVPAAENAVPAEPDPAKLEADLQRLTLTRTRLAQAKIALERQKQAYESVPVEIQRSREDAEKRLENVKRAAELADQREMLRLGNAQNALENVQKNLANFETDRALRERELNANLELKKIETELMRQKLNDLRANYEINARTIVDVDTQQLDNPLVGDTLFISNRRVEMNGVVTMNLANYVCSRLAFYDNQDPEKPIFIVITSSPGGSIFAGYQILKAMESCRAPVHVVVKSAAASMAAVVTTLAPNSYCLKSTMILHHQPSSSIDGNVTAMEEDFAFMKKWCGFFFEKVAAKLGTTYKDMVADMYKNYQSGDWLVYGNDAEKLGWVGHCVARIVETPSAAKPQPTTNERPKPAMVRRDDSGRAFIELPKLQAGDAWWLSDPAGKYRVTK